MYRVIAIPEPVAAGVRSRQKSPFGGWPTLVEIATGHGPCRFCLGTFTVGVDRRILFTYDQFAEVEPYPLPGPVFIHEAECARYPENGGFPPDLLPHPLTFFAYGKGRELMAQERIADGQVEPVIERLLELPDVDYIQVCDTRAGCYDFRIEQSE